VGIIDGLPDRPTTPLRQSPSEGSRSNFVRDVTLVCSAVTEHASSSDGTFAYAIRTMSPYICASGTVHCPVATVGFRRERSAVARAAWKCIGEHTALSAVEIDHAGKRYHASATNFARTGISMHTYYLLYVAIDCFKVTQSSSG
jgi:hypothetical protein